MSAVNDLPSLKLTIMLLFFIIALLETNVNT